MQITKYGLTFGTIFVDSIGQWFWSVWEKQSPEFATPPVFFGFVDTEKEVTQKAEEYSLPFEFGLPLDFSKAYWGEGYLEPLNNEELYDNLLSTVA